MCSITVKNVPTDVYERMKQSGKANRRSINSEIIVILEEAVKSKKTAPEDALARARLWRSEMRNVLALYMRRGLLSLADAQQIVAVAADVMKAQEYEVTSTHVLELVDVSNCSAYDCESVALARDLGAFLVTVDQQILSDFPDTAISLEEFVRVK